MTTGHRRVSKKYSIVVTAGPTREKIDPVRFISNYSTGVFGYEIARQAYRRGCRVTLISGPTCLVPPTGAKVVRVESALDMRRAVKKAIKGADCLIMAAAVGDWRVRLPAKSKIKRRHRMVRLDLVENPDILGEIGKAKKPGQVLVGFALETGPLVESALSKLRAKKVDIIIANRLSLKKTVFGNTVTDIFIADKHGNTEYFYRKTKKYLTKIILDKVLSYNI